MLKGGKGSMSKLVPPADVSPAAPKTSPKPSNSSSLSADKHVAIQSSELTLSGNVNGSPYVDWWTWWFGSSNGTGTGSASSVQESNSTATATATASGSAMVGDCTKGRK
jgi:hypothetical protein